MFSHCLRQVRGYATKSKTTNMKMTARVPLERTSLSDGTVFVTRQPPVPLQVQATAPAIHRPHERKTNLSEKEINEIRQLRQQDPTTWTRKKLADKFDCSPLFISMVAPSPDAKQPTPPATMSSEKGYRRQLITKNRQRRRELW
ncbi:mitochondrial ribosomal protein subunit L20-domain-containing protein [Chlamydoabsidia padenii]|nr:mitochondrial ribosomal protein subunit L20-domain-containing protein [Chlamydoabsidia padenii]